MIRMFFALAVSLFLGMSTSTARGQEVVKGKSTKGSPKTAPPDAKNKGFDVKGPEVVKAVKGRPLKLWDVNQQGPTDRNYGAVSVGVENVIMYSNGRMRWMFWMFNKGERTQEYPIDLPGCYLSDDQGETYKSLAYEFQPDNNGSYQLVTRGGTKSKFWVEFDLPKQETDSFKVGIVLLRGGGRPIETFKPFSVKLVEPISLAAAEPKPALPEAKADPDTGAAAGKDEPPLEKAKRKEAVGKKGTSVNPVDALKELSEKGQRFEGNVQPKLGDSVTGGILFDKKPGKGAISARIYRRPGSPAGTKVIGSIVEDVTVSSGVKLELLDNDEVTYTFVLDGKSLTGSDSKGTRYTFTLKP